MLIIIILLVFSLSACTSPELKLKPGQDTVEINTEWTDAGAVSQVGAEEYDLTTDDIVDTSTLGLYEITYTYQDDDQQYTITRFVQVTDQTPPVITLNAGLDTISVGDNWEDAGASVTDNSIEELEISVSGEVDTSTAGTYEITYTAIDSSGNTETLIRYVDVLE